MTSRQEQGTNTHLVAEELVGKRPVVRVAAQRREVAEGGAARARVHAHAAVDGVESRRVTDGEALRVAVELQTQLRGKKTRWKCAFNWARAPNSRAQFGPCGNQRKVFTSQTGVQS